MKSHTRVTIEQLGKHAIWFSKAWMTATFRYQYPGCTLSSHSRLWNLKPTGYYEEIEETCGFLKYGWLRLSRVFNLFCIKHTADIIGSAWLKGVTRGFGGVDDHCGSSSMAIRHWFWMKWIRDFRIIARSQWHLHGVIWRYKTDFSDFSTFSASPASEIELFFPFHSLKLSHSESLLALWDYQVFGSMNDCDFHVCSISSSMVKLCLIRVSLTRINRLSSPASGVVPTSSQKIEQYSIKGSTPIFIRLSRLDIRFIYFLREYCETIPLHQQTPFVFSLGGKFSVSSSKTYTEGRCIEHLREQHAKNLSAVRISWSIQPD